MTAVACTVIARNYRAYARLLADSFLAHHPGGRVFVLVLDDPDRTFGDGEPFEVLHPDDIGLDRDEFFRMAAIYDVLELATAVKPWLLAALLDRFAAVLYLDPDIEVHAPLSELISAAAERSIVLTPHSLEPMPRDDRYPEERTILLSGVYNLGFLGVGRGARPFLRWWAERLARDCLVSIREALFVDQRWVDFVPSYFEHEVVRDPGCNVAYWNLHQRTLTRTDDGWDVDGRPLRFFHFSGFDPERPDVLSRFQYDRPRVGVSGQEDLGRLCLEYAERLLRAGYRASIGAGYGWSRTATGLRLDRRSRRLYRKDLLDAELKQRPEPPNPFGDPVGFLTWLNTSDDWRATRVSRYMRAVRDERPELVDAFPELAGSDAARFLRWVNDRGRDEGIPPQLLAAARADGPLWDPLRDVGAGGPEGVTVAGYLRAEHGVGEGARLLVAALDAAGVDYSLVPYERTRSRQHAPMPPGPQGVNGHPVAIVCVNADQLPVFAADGGAELLEHRYAIGMWAWEVDVFPGAMAKAGELVDEIWVGSAHSAAAVASATSRPVHVLPLPVVVPDASTSDRGSLGLPEGFLVLFTFDFDSVVERKNPLGAIEAYRRAFPAGSDARLLIKSVNGDKHPAALDALRAAVADRPDIHVRDAYVPADLRYAITASCDAYLSLHRAEGFGLTMAEAMAMGKPVVATGYSGNLQYMDERNSWLVPYDLVSVPDGCSPYPVTARWADPDVEAAAAALKAIHADPAEARARGARARADMERLHGPRARVPFLLDRLEAARGARVTAVGDPFDPAAPPDPSAKPSWIEEAQGHIDRGPDLGTPTRYGAASRAARRAVLRAMRHYQLHQDELSRSLLNAIRDLQERIDAEGEWANEAVAGAQAALEGLQAEWTRVRQLRKELLASLSDTDAVPYTSDPARLRTTDPSGRETIGFRGRQDDLMLAGYRGFEDVFRGTEELIRHRQRVYVDVLAGRGPVLDIGAGRGELLELLAEAGVEATGVDTDADMVERCRDKGLHVQHGDGIEHLGSLADGSLGAVFCAQVVEHLPYESLVRLIDLSIRKLRPGGALVVETINPHSWRALKTFWVDPTHRAPLFPETLVALCGAAGYEEAYVLFPTGTGDLDADRRRCGEYAVVATTGSGAIG